MIIGIPRESLPGETRVAATPQTVGQLLKLGYEVVVESGAGAASSFTDEAYTEAGAAVGTAAKRCPTEMSRPKGWPAQTSPSRPVSPTTCKGAPEAAT